MQPEEFVYIIAEMHRTLQFIQYFRHNNFFVMEHNINNGCVVGPSRKKRRPKKIELGRITSLIQTERCRKMKG